MHLGPMQFISIERPLAKTRDLGSTSAI